MAEEKKVGAPYGNKNAEKWTFRKSVQLFHEAIELTEKKDDKFYQYDFIGEIAAELGTFKEIFEHLTKRFQILERLKKQLHTNIERNCYSNVKKGGIKEATGIINLKSNWKWKDRVDNTTDDRPVESHIHVSVNGKQVDLSE